MSAPTTVQWLRTAADRVSVGSQRLIARTVGRVLRAIGRRVGGWPWWVQIPLAYLALLRGPELLAGVGARIHEGVESGAWSKGLTVSAVVWVVAAYRVGGRPDEPVPAAPEEAEEQEAAAKETEAAPTAAGPPPISPVELVAAVRDIGTPNAQLVPLAKHLGTTTDAVRAAAQQMAWAVKDVRMQGRSASAGLRWDEAPSPDEVYPLPDVVGAGQTADDNDDDTSQEGPGERFRVVPIGSEGRIVYDSHDTVRHHKVRGQ